MRPIIEGPPGPDEPERPLRTRLLWFAVLWVASLAAVAANLNRYPNSTIEVIGHADNSGSAAYNQDLSERRALSVAGVLRANGVAGGRVSAYGRGESQPVASNLTEQGKAQNRRVEIIIRPTR